MKTNFGEDFRTNIEDSAQPDWIKQIRRSAFGKFEENGFPTPKDEEWKYTDLRSVAAGDWRLADAKRVRTGDDGESILFCDGTLVRLQKGLEDIQGLRVLPFSEAAEDPVFAGAFAKICGEDESALAALNLGFAENGVFIHVAANAAVDVPLRVEFQSVSDAAVFPRILYVGEKGSSAELLEIYDRELEHQNLTVPVTEISLADNARLVHVRVQRESAKAFHIGLSKAVLSRDSYYDSTNINFGGRIARHDANLEFTAENGEAFVDGLYITSDGQHADTHSRIDHKVKNCVSHQNYKGILDGKSRAIFNGKVFVHRDASGTDAEQSNKNLLLSNDARVDTKPQLEIFNDDVKCSHGATVGQLEESEMFYLLSRGLNENLARNLLTYGFAEEIINKIGVEDLKRDLDAAVLGRLKADI